jgi:hypothetical protein
VGPNGNAKASPRRPAGDAGSAPVKAGPQKKQNPAKPTKGSGPGIGNGAGGNGPGRGATPCGSARDSDGNIGAPDKNERARSTVKVDDRKIHTLTCSHGRSRET